MANISLDDIQAFRGRSQAWTEASVMEAGEGLSLPDWGDDHWREFLQHTDVLETPAGEPLIQRGESGTNLYFVVKGKFEVFPINRGSLSLGALVRVQAGSVLGEQAFFDGGPRSAHVWSIEPCMTLRMSRQQFDELEASSPTLARDLVLALARILSIRLRKITSRFLGKA